MSIRRFIAISAALACLCIAAPTQAALDGVADTVQSGSDILIDGSAFLFVEGESAAEIGGPGAPGNTWIVVNKDTPIQTRTEVGDPPMPVVKGGLDVLPADTNAYGGAAIFDDQPGSFTAGDGAAIYEVQFALPGTYYMYMHWSVYNGDTSTNYLSEDSLYVSPDFNLNSSSDWIGYEGISSADGLPKTGDGTRDGYIDGFPVLTQITSAGVTVGHTSTDEDFWDGQFHWTWIDRANDMNSEGGFINFFGFAIQYDVAPEDVGTTLTFEISTREAYGAVDAVLFSTSNSLLQDFTQNQLDQFFNPITGDMDFDNDVDFDDIDDFVLGLNDAAEYETIFGLPASFNGDTDDDGDQDFDDISGFVALLTSGSGNASVVPEPSTWALALGACGMVVYQARRRRIRRSG